MPGSPTRHQGDHLAARELTALTGSTNPRQEEGNQAANTTDGRSIAKESPEPRNNWKEATRTEELPKGGHQGFRDTGEKALGEQGTLDGAAEAKRTKDTTSTLEEKTSTPQGERGTLDGAAEAKKTEETTSTLEEKTPTLWDQTQKRPSSPTYNQGTDAKRWPKGSRGGRRTAEEEHLAKSPQQDTIMPRSRSRNWRAAKGKQQGHKNRRRQIHRRGITRAKKLPERSHQD